MYMVQILKFSHNSRIGFLKIAFCSLLISVWDISINPSSVSLLLSLAMCTIVMIPSKAFLIPFFLVVLLTFREGRGEGEALCG